MASQIHAPQRPASSIKRQDTGTDSARSFSQAKSNSSENTQASSPMAERARGLLQPQEAMQASRSNDIQAQTSPIPKPSRRETINKELTQAQNRWNERIKETNGNYSYRAQRDNGHTVSDYTLTYKDGKLHSVYDNINKRVVTDPDELEEIPTAEEIFGALKEHNNSDEYVIDRYKFGPNGAPDFQSTHTVGAFHFYSAKVTDFKPLPST